MDKTPPAKSDEYWFIFQNQKLVMISTNETYTPINSMDFEHLAPHLYHQHAIGTFNGIACFCAEIDDNVPLAETLHALPLRKAFEALGQKWYVPVARAISIILWDKNHQFCGQCGTQTKLTPPHFERTCPACGLAAYPRISPSVIVLIKKGTQLLMSRSPHFAPGAYGLIAGFVEAGEGLEDAVHREVKEEVSLTIKNLHYFGSQAWPFPDSLMVGFTAEYESGEIVIDHTEIETAGWFEYDNLPGRPSTNVSIAHKLIEDFINEQQGLKHGNL